MLFVEKMEYHPSSTVPYFVYLPVFLLSNRSKVLDREHSKSFHQLLFKLDCLELPFWLYLFFF